jgi:hypothetical protein
MTSRTSLLLLSSLAITLLAGCGDNAPTTPRPSATATPPASASTPSGGPSAVASAEPIPASASAAPAAGQTDTDWGRIWDAVPADFPRFPGSRVADDMGDLPVSARFAVDGGDPEAIAAWMQSAMETATYSTEGLNGPLEDGSMVLDSVGDGGCRIQMTIAPLGGTTFITVRYGAACPLH